MHKLGLVLPVLLMSLSGCMVRDYVRKKDRQIDYLEASNRQMVSQVLAMDSLSKEQTELLAHTKAEMTMRFGELDNKIGSVESRLGDIESLFYRKSPRSATSDTSRRSQNIYNIAYSDFTKGNYDLAITGFRQYLSGLRNAEDANYWIGECYYALEDYQNAEESFKNVINNFPVSKKAPTALYKLITIYNITEDTLNMQKYLDRLIERYPSSPEARLLKKAPPKKDLKKTVSQKAAEKPSQHDAIDTLSQKSTKKPSSEDETKESPPEEKITEPPPGDDVKESPQEESVAEPSPEEEMGESSSEEKTTEPPSGDDVKKDSTDEEAAEPPSQQDTEEVPPEETLPQEGE